MRRLALLPLLAVTAVAVVLAQARAEGEPSPAQLVGDVEQQVAAAVSVGERLTTMGDACLQAIAAAPADAPGLCGVFLEGVRDFDGQTASVSAGVASLQDALTDEQIAAVSPVQARLTDAIVRLMAVLDRLGSQAEDASAWMRQTADAWTARTEADVSDSAD